MEAGSYDSVTATFRKLEPTIVELDIDVSAADLDAARERAFQKLVKQYRLPGFRPGRVPRRIFEQKVGVDAIEHQAVEDVVPDAYSKALKEHNLEPVERPRIDLEHVDEGKSLRIKAVVAVRPEIVLANHRQLAVDRPAVEVSDDDVERSLQALRKRAATLEPVNGRGVQIGDVVTMDYVGTIAGRPFDGGTANDHTTEVSPEKFVPGFAEQLLGAQPGDKRTVNVTFPEAYHVELLRAKAATFEVVVHEVKMPVLPPLDDAFVAQVSEAVTLDALRADIRKRLEAVGSAQAREAMQKKLLEQLASAHDFPLPDVLVQNEIESLVGDAKSYMQRIGRPWEEYLAAKNVDEDGLRAEYRVEAERRVRTSLLLEEIAKVEAIEVTTGDLERELAQLARSYGLSRDSMLELIRKNTGFGPLIDSVRKQKAIDFLVEHATVTDVAASLAGH
jgi:trigger factor